MEYTHKDTGSCSAHQSKKNPHQTVTQKLSGEDALRVGRTDREALLQDEQDQQNTTDNPECNFLPCIPIEQVPTEVDSHDQSCKGADIQGCAEVVNLQ